MARQRNVEEKIAVLADDVDETGMIMEAFWYVWFSKTERS